MSADLTKIESEVLLSKRSAWADVGEVIHTTEQEIKTLAVQNIAKLLNPKSIEELPAAEAALKESKAGHKVIQEKRMEITNKFKSVAERLMTNEKTVEASWPEIEKSMLTLKQQKEANEKLEKAKELERKTLKEACINHVNNSDIEFRKSILAQCTLAYEYALGKGDVTEKTYDEYYNKVEAKFTDADFTTTKPVIKLNVIPQAEFDLIWDECSLNVKPSQTYIDQYKKDLTEKFSFFTISLKRKEAALKQAATVDAEKAAALANEANSKTVAASLQAASTTVAAAVPVKETKDLKKVYVLDMESNDENMLKIMAAFVASYNEARQYVKVKDIFSLNVTQMGAALVSIKNKDNKFEITGINFKLTDKL